MMRAIFATAMFLLGLLPSSAMAQEILRMPERPASSFYFLQGCWITDEFKHAPVKLPGRSTYCFDANGRGTLVYTNSLHSCRLPVEASYAGSHLKLIDRDGKCDDGDTWGRDELDCQRGANDVAFCSGQAIDPSTSKLIRWTVNLRRQGPAPTAAPPPASAPGGKPQKFKSMLD